MATTATAVWRVRTGGNENNGGGYDPGISGAGTDYSQQDAAQQLFTTRLTTSGAGSTTLTDGSAGSLFTSAMVGNAINITAGTNFQTGIYWITAFTDANNVVLDRTPSSGGAGSAGTGRVGGAWAKVDSANYTSTNVKAGNIIYYRASGTGSVASPDYTVAGFFSAVQGDTTNGMVKHIGENGRPFIKGGGSESLLFYNANYDWYENLYIAAGGATHSDYGLINFADHNPNDSGVGINIIFDQNAFDITCWRGAGTLAGCECFSSSTAAAGTAYAVQPGNGFGLSIVGCNIHDTIGNGVNLTAMARVSNSVIAKCAGDGIACSTATVDWCSAVQGCTIDGNGGHGINITQAVALAQISILGNIISNHTGVGKAGIKFSGTGTLAQADRIRGLIDFNNFYNNTADCSGITKGGTSTLNGHTYADTSLDPQYVAQSTENYAIGTNLKALGYPQSVFLQSKSGQTTGVRSYMDAGAVQRQEVASGGVTVIVNQIKNLFVNRKVI